ncbi:MAG: nuclease [Pseudomonadota bacterium]
MRCLLIALCLSGTAAADPCEGDLPTKAGTVFTGITKYIVDGDGLCVGASEDPGTWVEVRFVDFNAPELQSSEGRKAKEVLSDLALGQSIECVTTRGRHKRTRSFDRVHAQCAIDGASVASLMREAGVTEGGR